MAETPQISPQPRPAIGQSKDRAAVALLEPGQLKVAGQQPDLGPNLVDLTVLPGQQPEQPQLSAADVAETPALEAGADQSPAALTAGTGAQELEAGSTPAALEAGKADDAKKLKIVIAGLGENIRAQANDAGAAELNRTLESGGKFKRFLKQVWHGSLSREYQVTKNRKAAEGKIVDSQNLLVHEGVTADEYREQTLLRFGYDFDQEVRREDLIHENAGEQHASLVTMADRGDAEAMNLRNGIYDLVRQYVNGNFADDASFAEAERRLLVTHGQPAGREGNGMGVRDTLGDARVYASNLKDIADTVRAAASEQNVSVDSLLNDAEIVIGQARIGARTQHEQTRVERIYEKIDALGGPTRSVLINETTLSAGLAALTFATKGVASVATHMVAPGVVGGLFAAQREARALRHERTQHTREMAEGKGDPAILDGRRVKLEKTRYEARPAQELINDLQWVLDSDIADGADLKNRIATIAYCQARIEASDTQGIDLIGFSDTNAVQEERFNLDLELARAKVGLRRLMGDPSFLTGDTNADQVRTAGFDGFLRGNVDAQLGIGMVDRNNADANVASHIFAQDAKYRKLRNARVATAFVKGTFLGAIVAGAEFGAHELAGVVGGGAHTAASAQLTAEGQPTPPHIPLSGHTETIPLGPNANVTLPSEFHVSTSGNELTVTGPQGFHTIHASLGQHGAITAHDRALIQQSGFSVSSLHGVTSESGSVVQHNVSASNLVHNHPGSTTDVQRNFWYENNTAQPDQNELAMDWGGHNGTGLDGHGGYSFSVAGMTHGGSFEGPHAVDWQQAASHGDLKLALSASQGTQAHVFLLNVEPNGTVDIPADSPASHLFSVVNGHTQFNGAYAETAQVVGNHAGVTEIAPLATVVGDNHATFTDVVPTQHNVPFDKYTLTYHGPGAHDTIPAGNAPTGGNGIVGDAGNDTPFRPFVVVPPVPRDGLTPLTNPEPLPEPDQPPRGELPAAETPPQGPEATQVDALALETPRDRTGTGTPLDAPALERGPSAETPTEAQQPARDDIADEVAAMRDRRQPAAERVGATRPPAATPTPVPASDDNTRNLGNRPASPEYRDLFGQVPGQVPEMRSPLLDRGNAIFRGYDDETKSLVAGALNLAMGKVATDNGLSPDDNRLYRDPDLSARAYRTAKVEIAGLGRDYPDGYLDPERFIRAQNAFTLLTIAESTRRANARQRSGLDDLNDMFDVNKRAA